MDNFKIFPKFCDYLNFVDFVSRYKNTVNVKEMELKSKHPSHDGWKDGYDGWSFGGNGTCTKSASWK